MSRDNYGGYSGRNHGGDRWDAERFESERDRMRFGGESRDRDRFDERDSRFSPRGGGFGSSRPRDRSDEDFDRRGPPPRGYDDRGGPSRFEEDRYEKRVYYDDEPRFEREPPLGRQRGQSTNITIEKEREFFESSPPRRAPVGRPSFLRRQSSLDTFDRKPLGRFMDREEYGPPARYHREEARLPPLTPIPLPRTRQLGPPPRRRHDERDYDDIRVAEPDFYGDDEFRGYPERVREREIVRTNRRRRSRSRESRSTHSVAHSARSSSRSSSRSTSVSNHTTRSEFPKKGKTRMPARLVSKQAIIDLGYPFEEEGDVIIIQKALGRENIDEVIKLSEDYHNAANPPVTETTLTTYVVGTEAPPPPPPVAVPPPPPAAGHMVFEEHTKQEGPGLEVITDTKVVEHRAPSPAHTVVEHRHLHHNSNANPVIIDAHGPQYHDAVPSSALVVAPARVKDERAILAEIRALEAEKELLRAERRAARRHRHGARSSEGDLVLYEHNTYERPADEVMIVRKEYVEPEGGVKILKDRKGRMAISVPKYLK